MTSFEIVYAPNPIFKQKAQAVPQVDQTVKNTLHAMCQTMYQHQAIGLGANMVGILQQLVVVDLQENGEKTPYLMANPQIIAQSETTQTFMEASISFRKIKAKVTRPAHIKVQYLDLDNQTKILEASGWLATVLQHEIDYLHGITFLDHLSKTKRKLLLEKLKR